MSAPLIQTGGSGGGGGTPGGSNTQLQYNAAGAFGGVPLTWNGTVFSASASLGVNQTSPQAALHVGNSAANNSVDSQILISHAVDDSVSGNGHAFSDSSTITRTGGTVGYNSYDARVLFSGSANYDHYAGIQNAPTYDCTGTINWIYGDISVPTLTKGTVNNLAAFYAGNPSKTAPAILSANYGLYVEDLTSGNANYAVYTVGSAFSQFGGRIVGLSDIFAGNGNVQLLSAGDVQIKNGHFFYWAGGPGLDSSTDGIIRIANNAVNDFNRLQFGGTTSSYPALKRSSAELIVRLADDSANANLQLAKISNYNAVATVAGGVPAEYAVTGLTAQAANVAATTVYAIPAAGAGLYRISVYIIVSQAGTTSTMPDTRITYTDRDSGATITVNVTASSTGNTTSTFAQSTLVINAKASTNVQYDIGQVNAYASTGGTPMQFAYRNIVEAL
jgi:hypothetical protein